MYILQFLHLFSSSLDFIEKTAKDHEKESLREKIIEKCEELLPRDIRDNKSMGQHGALHILNSKLLSWDLLCHLYYWITYRHYSWRRRHQQWKESQDFDTLQYRLISHWRIRHSFGCYQSFAWLWTSRCSLLHRNPTLQSRFPIDSLWVDIW